YLKQKKYSEAINVFKKAIESDPFHVSAYTNLGLAYKQEGCHQEALHAFEKASHLKPDAEVYRNLGESYASMGDYEKAIETLIKAAGLNSQDENVYYQMGSIYLNKLEQFSKAREALQKAVHLNAKITDIHFQLGV